MPFFAMEYVVGARSITEYAKAKSLGTRARLAIFAKVCDAVHHGHQKGIIHRDLKPGNILVDSRGNPKIIDFGVARATDSDMAATTLQTDIGQLIGTLRYMSPEQCEADPHDIDTRSGVYALGVVLYELLTKHGPYGLTRGGAGDPRAAAGAPEHAGPDAARRRRDDRAQGAGEGAGAAVPLGGSAGRGRRPVPAERADPGAACERAVPDRPLCPPSPRPRGRGGEAGELWPAHRQQIAAIEGWLARAREVYERLGQHEAALALRARALPRTAEEAAAERASHPKLPALETAQGRLAWLRRSLAIREGEDAEPAPEPDRASRPEDATALNEMAWPLVDHDRERFGAEARALALARRAAELAPLDAGILRALAWALFANGLGAEAEETSRRALAAAHLALLGRVRAVAAPDARRAGRASTYGRDTPSAWPERPRGRLAAPPRLDARRRPAPHDDPFTIGASAAGARGPPAAAWATSRCGTAGR